VEDNTDQKIVRLLLRDGRMSYTDLGKATGLSTSAVHQRVRRLEQQRVIRGYTAVVDTEVMGFPLTAFVSVKPAEPNGLDETPARLAALAEIEACHSVAGEESYLLKVRVASPCDLEQLLAKIRLVARVSTKTTIVLSTPFEARPLPERPRG